MTSPSPHFRSCNLCEAICGLVIEHDGERVIKIKGDDEDPLSRGHICPKAVALRDIQEDGDRLRMPVERVGDEWREISWDAAFTKVAEGLGRVREQHGNDAVATYFGNPTVHNYGAVLFLPFLARALSTRNRFSATSVDQLPHHFVANLMYGHLYLIPVPDIDRTEHILILGANPVVSNGSMLTAPGFEQRLRAIQKREGKVVVVDPRFTETARIADEHHFVHPGSDALLLAALLHVIFAQGLEHKEPASSYVKNLPALAVAVSDCTPELASTATGIEAAEIARMAIEFATAARAVCYGRMGLSTQAHGSVCQWLVQALNLTTGNLDRPGGLMFPKPAVNIVGRESTLHHVARWRSRVRGLPEVDGQLPVAVLAEEILTPGDGSIRALVTNAGNPVLSTPNGRQLERALEQLDFMVALDIYINETTRHADVILPPTCGLETENYDLVFNALATRNVAKYSPPLFPPAPGALHDWEILRELARRVARPMHKLRSRLRQTLDRTLLRILTPRRILNIGLSIGPYGAWRGRWRNGLNLRRLEESPHGVDLGSLTPRLPALLRCADGKVDAAPKPLVKALAKIVLGVQPEREESKTTASFSLLGRRHLRSNNSWMHQCPTLIKGKNRCTLLMHRDDALALGLKNGSDVVVRSHVGEVCLPLEVTSDILRGVVSIPHGYGHHADRTRIPIAAASAGVSINDLTDDRALDSQSGNAAFSGQMVSVHSASPSIH